MADHYGTLGVEATATAEEIRRAYLRRARALHPDRYVDAGHDEQGRTQAAMQQVNAAWRVLGNAERRAAYDRTRSGRLSAGPPPGPRPAGPAGRPTYRTVEDVARRTPEGSERTVLARALPWLVVAGIGIAIFVFSAFAGGPADERGGGSPTGACVAVDPVNGQIAQTDCAGPNDGAVVAYQSEARICPPGSRRVPVPGEDNVICLVPAGNGR